MTRPFQLDLRHIGNGCAVLAVTGDLDPATAPHLREQGQALLADGPVQLLLDMSRVDFCDSSGLSTVLGLWQQARAGGGSLGLVAVPDRLARLLRITATDTLITVHPAEDLDRLTTSATEPA
ncbi:STAS domain-containing protein [Saccharothrix sp. S26]|uniref:STAS domain-containing protein n=1 Tax=Saccharothrix sp. S26 TaxID=2907215 RepID=UPI001F1CE3BF|nr:STAS domain-containing protein [Saccharothrix sp. S26]MCE6995551.1 STAS domain-containing protein [Saccharothrix sp. S26]